MTWGQRSAWWTREAWIACRAQQASILKVALEQYVLPAPPVATGTLPPCSVTVSYSANRKIYVVNFRNQTVSNMSICGNNPMLNQSSQRALLYASWMLPPLAAVAAGTIELPDQVFVN